MARNVLSVAGLFGSEVATGAIAWALAAPQPDILVAGDGQTAAFRGKDGRLAVLRAGRDIFAIKEWLAADADARTPKIIGVWATASPAMRSVASAGSAIVA